MKSLPTKTSYTWVCESGYSGDKHLLSLSVSLLPFFLFPFLSFSLQLTLPNFQRNQPHTCIVKILQIILLKYRLRNKYFGFHTKSFCLHFHFKLVFLCGTGPQEAATNCIVHCVEYPFRGGRICVHGEKQFWLQSFAFSSWWWNCKQDTIIFSCVSY